MTFSTSTASNAIKMVSHKQRSLSSMVSKDLLPGTVAVLVTPKYIDRVTDALLGKSEEWLNAQRQAPETRKRPLVDGSCRVVSTPDTEKMSQVYVLLFIENTITSLKSLHPMVRQNMSWGVDVTHDFKGDGVEKLIPEIYAELLRSGFDLGNDVLRAHAFPKDINETVCRSLQEAAGGICEDGPYDGPIQMTASRSKCTHVVTVIRHETGYVWEVQDQATHFAAKYNHNANDELLLEPTDSSTGKDLSSISVAANIPVSRAYYKLRQAWDEILSLEFRDLSDSMGIDLGASPGGWTQVLKYIGLEKVVSIDPGALAKRVESMPGVVHVAVDMTSDDTVNAIEATGVPISLLVCDACIFSGEIIEKTIELIERLDHDSWALPAAFVITLKMPYRQAANLNRNIENAKKKIPSLLSKAGSIMYKNEVKIRYKVVHLMANSPLERTLVAIFEPM